jgi:hypothetical protein
MNIKQIPILPKTDNQLIQLQTQKINEHELINEKQLQDTITRELINEKQLVYNCVYCDYFTNFINDIKLHNYIFHKLNKCHHCKHCNYISKTEAGIKNHYLNFHASYQERKAELYYCKSCNKNFISSNVFQRHIKSKIHKIKDKKSQCKKLKINYILN